MRNDTFVVFFFFFCTKKYGFRYIWTTPNVDLQSKISESFRHPKLQHQSFSTAEFLKTLHLLNAEGVNEASLVEGGGGGGERRKLANSNENCFLVGNTQCVKSGSDLSTSELSIPSQRLEHHECCINQARDRPSCDSLLGCAIFCPEVSY